MEILYLSEKDCAVRYGFSRNWFSRARWMKKGPNYIKPNGGKILYPLKETDEYFESFLKAARE